MSNFSVYFSHQKATFDTNFKFDWTLPLKFTKNEIEKFWRENKYLSMYAQENRRLSGKKRNFGRDTQPYIFRESLQKIKNVTFLVCTRGRHTHTHTSKSTHTHTHKYTHTYTQTDTHF